MKYPGINLKLKNKHTKTQTHKDLEIWQLAMDLVEMTYKITKKFPKEEQYGLSTQLRRSAVSIPSNIAWPV